MSDPTLWFDVTASFHWRRAPSGITRVEQECLRWALQQDQAAVGYCVYESAMQCWYSLPRAEARAVLARAYDEQGNALPETVSSWRPQSSPLRFAEGDAYLCLNADQTLERWQELYRARCGVGLRIHAIVYDLIQVLYPHFYWSGADQGCARYLVDLASCADHVFSISRRTEDDLYQFYREVGVAVPEISVVRLGDELSPPSYAPSVNVQRLAEQPFILTVGSVEIRKNHELLYRSLLDLWSRGQLDIPRLVFAGMKGWRVDDLLMSLELDPRVRERIVLVPHASDADIDYLYQHCLFTSFPSQYEGWGLPVAESLAYGKLCVAAATGAIPEIAPAEQLVLLPPFDVRAWADCLRHFSHDSADRLEYEQRIRRGYRVTAWRDTAEQIVGRALAAVGGDRAG